MTIRIEKTRWNKSNYQDMAFIISAINKKDARLALRYIKIEDGLVIGTDGHRLHMAYMKDSGINMLDGLYNFVKTAKEIILTPAEDTDLNYPTWEQVFPTDNNNVVINLSSKLFLNEVISMFGLNSDFKQTLDINYLADLQVDDTAWTMTLFENSKNELNPAMFQNCTKTALIMPYRVRR